jgi:hypothetical protein
LLRLDKQLSLLSVSLSGRFRTPVFLPCSP